MQPNTEYKKIQEIFYKLLEQPLLAFPAKKERMDIPIKKGVYIIRDKNKEVLHVGQTPRAKQGIKQRIKNHLQGQSSFVGKHFNGNGNQLREQNCCFQFLIIDNYSEFDSRTRALLESYAIGRLCPKHIGTG